jgi:prophage regulatory protein
LLKLPQVADLCGLRSTSIYGQAKSGLFPPPVKLTARSSAWPEHEVAAVNAARIAGRSDAEIRQLVAHLVKQREQAAA